ncbi:MAG: 4Fe-4S ferredoxin, iron-sulfur binding domain protein [Acidobacteria bacterium]|nr:4Fe-4S ferredoxin, iron-sulfur binding domain protein [Acidobacteriota bacterium]
MGNTDRGDVQIAAHLCKGCCLCVAACPPGVLSQSRFLNRQGYYAIAYSGSGCTGCGICFYVCPEPGAITVRLRKEDKEAGEDEAVHADAVGSGGGCS